MALESKNKKTRNTKIMVIVASFVKFCVTSHRITIRNIIRKVVKTTTLEQDPPNHKIVGGVCLHPPCLTSKDGVFIA